MCASLPTLAPSVQRCISMVEFINEEATTAINESVITDHMGQDTVIDEVCLKLLFTSRASSVQLAVL